MPIVLRIAEASFAVSIARHFDFETTYSAAALAAPAFVGLSRFPVRAVGWRSEVRSLLLERSTVKPRRACHQTRSQLPCRTGGGVKSHTPSRPSLRASAFRCLYRQRRSEK